MVEKPRRALDYRSEQLERVRATCLYVATRLGDLMDEVVVVGGLVPSLLIDQDTLPEGTSAHVGTIDLDVGLKLVLLDNGRYRTLTQRLREAGFEQDRTVEGRLTRQRWRVTGFGSVTVDFLIPPSLADDHGGMLRDIERDFAAVIVPGLTLAFQDRRRVRLEGTTIFGEKAVRDVWVCGPGAFVVLKALAFLGRGGNKDAYDLYYVVRNFGAGAGDVAACLTPLLGDDEAQRAIQVLRTDFLDHEGVGPRRVAEFMLGTTDDEIQSDVVGFVKALLDHCALLRPLPTSTSYHFAATSPEPFLAARAHRAIGCT